MKKRPATIWLSVIMALMMIVMLTGCAATPSQDVENTQVPTPTQPTTPTTEEDKAVGAVLLSVNPEIKINFDVNGNVISLEGNNEDGANLLKDYSDYKGKPCKTVVNELVEKMNAAGYFKDKFEGNAKNIVVKLEDDRNDIYEDFIEELAEEVRETVRKNNIGSQTVVIDKADINNRGFIGIEKAKEIVLTQLGFNEADFASKEYELDDGVYELEFTVDGIEYEYDVDAITGKVLKAETEIEDKPEKPENKPQHGQKTIGKDKAKEIALAQKGFTEAQIKFYECEFDDGVYEVEFVVDGIEYNYDINAFTGKVLKTEIDKENDRIEPTPEKPEFIGKDKAKEIALAHKNFTEAQTKYYKCEFDEGKYEIEFTVDGIEYEYDIDAVTGKILKAGSEKDDDVIVPGTDKKEPIGEARAKEIALANKGFSASEISRYKCELDEGKYEIDFTANGIEYEYEIDAYSGAILKAGSEKDDDAIVPGTDKKEPIGEARAKEIALANTGFSASEISRYECELDEGKYEIEFIANGIEYDFEIDAYSGAILKAESERAD